ncbi:2'-5' RNA ligase family protein [Nonomuraea turkmeniaca]|uniref:2'-5' RNA ligase family protein n=1 Tax=Nonomuraea turkmeniaca TaxID=103838 RepID=UPI001476B3A9|nr:2'-5' RNA ligase family protein [Nonomuraea turkmeniaca]
MSTPWMERLEHKAVTAAPRSAQIATEGEGDGTVEALVAVTGVLDGVGDIIVPGAFARTLRERKPKGIFSHDTKIWTARTEVVEEWLPGDPRLPSHTKDGQPWPAEAGALYVRCRFNLKSDDGRNAYENVRFFSETDECEWSIGYQVPQGKSRKDPKTGIRRILDLDLYEYSPVLFGAASQSATLSVKAMSHAGDSDRNHGQVEQLRTWYVRGEGAARIRWNTAGAFDRCVVIASEHMTPDQAKGYCAERHHDATGRWPGAHHEKKASQGVGAEWADLIPDNPASAEDSGNSGGGSRSMVALLLPASVAVQLAQPGGLDPASLHVTLAYLGEGVDEETLATAEQAVADAAADLPPLTGRVGGIGVFPPGDDGVPVWATVDVPGLETVRERIIDALDAAGVPYSTEHGFTPHVTLAYIQPGEQPPAPLPPVDVTFTSVSIAVEDDHRHFPLAAAPATTETKDARLDALRAAGLPIPIAFEEARDKVRDAIYLWLASRGERGWVCVEATFADMAIVTVRPEHPAAGHLPEIAYQVPYSLTPAGDIFLGDPVPVTVTSNGAADPLVAVAAIEDAAYTIKHAADAWTSDTATSWEVKAGRVLSDANAKRLRQAMAILAEVFTSAGISHDPVPHEKPKKHDQELPPEPAIYPDSTAPSALPSQMKQLTDQEWAAADDLLDFASALA